MRKIESSTYGSPARRLRIPTALLAAGIAFAACTPGNNAAPKAEAKSPTTSTKAPEASSTTTTEPFGYNASLAASYNAERARLQAKLTPVSPGKLQALEALIENKGYLDSQLPDAKRIVVRGANGDSYTAELDFISSAANTQNNTLTAVTIYINKPGEPYAKQVVIDGSNGLVAPGDKQPIDGIVDSPLGYMPITSEQITQDVQQHGSYSADIEANEVLAQFGQEAQQDYITAVDQILTGTIIK